jgi:hypothetical protein
MPGLSQLIDLVIPAFMVVLAAWFYPHCARPSLAFASAPRRAFTVCLVATIVVMAGWLIFMANEVAVLLGERLLRGSWYRPALIALFVVWLIPAAGFLRPGWFSRLGPADPTSGPRFLLTWFRRQWPRFDDDATRLTWVDGLSKELEKVRVPGNAAFVDGWYGSIQAFAHAARLGRTSACRERLVLRNGWRRS